MTKWSSCKALHLSPMCLFYFAHYTHYFVSMYLLPFAICQVTLLHSLSRVCLCKRSVAGKLTFCKLRQILSYVSLYFIMLQIKSFVHTYFVCHFSLHEGQVWGNARLAFPHFKILMMSRMTSAGQTKWRDFFFHRDASFCLC